MKNIVFQVNIKGVRHKPEFDLSTQSWKKWADKNDCEVLVLDQFIREQDYMKANWQKWFIFDLLEHNNIEYDQILVVDADTIVHPDWRKAEEGDWVISDDDRIVQLLKVKTNVNHHSDTKNYNYANGWVRTVVGSFINKPSTKMDTDFSNHPNRYTFSTKIKEKII